MHRVTILRFRARLGSRVALLAALVLSSSASAQGLSLDTEGLFEPAPEGFAVCWERPGGWPRKARVSRFDRAFVAAANQTLPDHADARLQRMLGGVPASGCRFTVRPEFVGVRTSRGRALEIRVRDLQLDAILLEDTIGPVRAYRLQVDDFVPAWEKIWAVVAPTEPPAPEPSEVPPAPVRRTPKEPFVDPDLAELRAEREAALRPEPPPPVLTLMAQVGATARELDAQAGRPQDQSALLSFGVQGDLHLGGMFRWKRTVLDLSAEYWRQVVGAELGPESVGADADRTRATLRWGHAWFGTKGPWLGLTSGFAHRRFTFDDAASTLSVEYSALRTGGWIRQPIHDFSGTLLSLGAAGAARWTLGDGDQDVGADAHITLNLDHAAGFSSRIRAGYTHQTGTVLGTDFTDGIFDVSLGLGWAL